MTLARGTICLACVEDVAQSHAGLVLGAGTDEEKRLGVDGTSVHEAAAEQKPMVYVSTWKEVHQPDLL